MSEFQDALEQVRNEGVVDPTPTDPIPAGNDGTPTTPPVDDDTPQSVRDYVAKNPDAAAHVEELNRQFKAAFTPRLQEAAELRKQYEGLDPNVAAAVRHLQQLITTDPRNAAEYLRQQAQLLEGADATPAQPDTANTDPFSLYEPATEMEAVLAREVRELRRWQQEQSTQYQQIQQQQKAVAVQQEFGKLEQEFGIQVPVEERARAWELAELTQGRMTVTDAYFALNRNTVLPSLVQKARDEASSVVQQKAGLFTPGGLATREGPAPQSGPLDVDAVFREFNL